MRDRPLNLLIMGDSIALGATVVIGHQVVERARPHFVDYLRHRQSNWAIEADGQVQRTTDNAVGLMPQLLACHRPDAVLLVLGGSDADLDWKRFIVSRGRRVQSNTPLHRFADNLRSLIRMITMSGAAPVLSDVPNQDVLARGAWLGQHIGQNLMPWIEAGGGQAESDRRLAEYNQIVEDVSAETRVDIARWAKGISTLPPADRFGPDATHPSAPAHRIIARVVEQSIRSVAAQLPSRRRIVAEA